MESNPTHSAQEQLDSLAASREQTLVRLVLPWRYVIGWAIFANAFILPTVLPIVLSDGWTVLIMCAFLAGGVVLLLRTEKSQKSHQGVRRPKLRIKGDWILPVLFMSGMASAFALAIYASSKDNPWLGFAAVLINSAACLVVYGGVGFLLRRQFARFP